MFGSQKRTEYRLVRRAQAGDPEAFGQLADRYAGLAHTIAFARASNRTDAEDIVQDAFLKAYESLGTLRDPAKFGPWFLTIVRNRCRDTQAKHARRADLQSKVIPVKFGEQPVEQREIHALLRTKISKLDEMHAEVLLLHYFAGKPVKEMARLIEATPDTVKKRLQRAREALGAEMLKELEPLAPTAPHTITKTVAAVAIIVAVTLGGLWGVYHRQTAIPPLARPLPVDTPEEQVETPTTTPEVEVTPEKPEVPVAPPVVAVIPEKPEVPVAPPVVDVIPETPETPTASVEETPEKPETPTPKVEETPEEPVEAPPVETVVVPVPETPPIVSAPPIEEPKHRTRMAMAPLKLKLPEKSYMGTPLDYWSENLELTFKAREPFMAPAGTVNVAKGKPVTSSDKKPTAGQLTQLTDGDKEFKEKSIVEIGKGLQWVQVDLGEKHQVYAVVVWHYHQSERVYFDVVGQCADDADFTKNVKAFFNNDHDNSAGLGVGKQKEYIENNEGKLIDMKGVETRCIRLYSKGNTANDFNHYIEIEVYAKPSK